MAAIHLDYEARSRVNLKTQGTWNYSSDPSTSILCLQYAIDDGPTVLSHPPIGNLRGVNWPPVELLDHFSSQRSEIHAHNAFFERAISLNIGHKRLGWPKVDPYKWRCSLAVCAYYALPRSLENAGEALGLPVRKDMEGARILKKFMQPMKNGEWYWNEEEFKKLCNYCGTDVDVERAIGKRLGELPEYELRIWLLDQIINERGILFDRKLAESAIRIAESEKARANIEIYELTGGMVETTGARKSLEAWANTIPTGEVENVLDMQFPVMYDLKGKKLTKDTIPEMIKDPKVPDQVKKVLKVRSRVSVASVNKYKAMLNLMDSEGVVRDTLRYAGAGTLRWSGKGVQVQNFPRGYGDQGKENKKATNERERWKPVIDSPLGMDLVAECIKDGRLDWVEFFHGDKPMAALKKATRGSIIARPGKELQVADYAAIEARCLMWMVGDEAAISVLKNGCIYCDMATSIYGYEVRKKDHPDERQLGKQAILGLGYSMGYVKFLMTLHGYKMSLGEKLVRKLVGDRYEDLERLVIADSARIAKAGISVREHLVDLIGCKFIVDTYRAKYPLVKAFWRDVEAAARNAVKYPGIRQECGKVSYLYDTDMDFLFCRLPSGRNISYFKPELETSYQVSFWGEWRKGTKKHRKVKMSMERDRITGNEVKIAREYFSSKGYTLVSDEPDIWEQQKIFYMAAGKRGLEKSNIYGGLLTENISQAISRDLIAEAMLRSEERGYPPIMTVHDELVAETDIGAISVHDFEKLICELPAWAEGFPIAAEGFVTRRYRK